MPILGFSQNGYPKQILLGNDSLVVITPKQVKLLNLAKVELDETREMNNILQEQISLFKVTLGKYKKLSIEKDSTISNQNLLIQNRESLISEQEKAINTLNKSVKAKRVSTRLLIVTSTILSVLLIIK